VSRVGLSAIIDSIGRACTDAASQSTVAVSRLWTSRTSGSTSRAARWALRGAGDRCGRARWAPRHPELGA